MGCELFVGLLAHEKKRSRCPCPCPTTIVKLPIPTPDSSLCFSFFFVFYLEAAIQRLQIEINLVVEHSPTCFLFFFPSKPQPFSTLLELSSIYGRRCVSREKRFLGSNSIFDGVYHRLSFRSLSRALEEKKKTIEVWPSPNWTWARYAGVKRPCGGGGMPPTMQNYWSEAMIITIILQTVWNRIYSAKANVGVCFSGTNCRLLLLALVVVVFHSPSPPLHQRFPGGKNKVKHETLMKRASSNVDRVQRLTPRRRKERERDVLTILSNVGFFFLPPPHSSCKTRFNNFCDRVSRVYTRNTDDDDYHHNHQHQHHHEITKQKPCLDDIFRVFTSTLTEFKFTKNPVAREHTVYAAMTNFISPSITAISKNYKHVSYLTRKIPK